MQKLAKKDEQAILNYTKENPYINLFIIGDLMMDGFNDKIQKFYGRYEDNRLVNILMEYQDSSLHLYADKLNNTDLNFIEKRIDSAEIKALNWGEKTEVLIHDWIKTKTSVCQKTNLSVLKPETPITYNAENVKVEKATIEDAKGIQELLASVFEDTRDTVERLVEAIRQEKRLIYIIKENNKVVSTASAVAFTDDAAMIIGVGTSEDARNKGYASYCVQKLCYELQQQNRGAVLFYDNPKAGSIYHKLGFVDLETYYIYKTSKTIKK